MRGKLFLEFCLTILIFFIVAGDMFLPQPYRNESQQFRNNINSFLIGLLPDRFNIEAEAKTNDDY